MIFNPAVPYEVPHMILAAYLVTGFLIASVYAVGMLRGRRDRYHRLGLLIPLTVASIATPIQFAVGDTAARAIADHQPIKFAAMECVQKTSTHVTEYIYGRCTSSGVKGGIGIPGFDSFLVGWSTDTQVTGPRLGAARRPAAGQHDAPLGLRHDGRDLHGADRARGSGSASSGGASATSRRRKWFLRAVAVSGVAAIVALECGWIVTEVGRQPWVVYEVMRTEDAVTGAERRLGHVHARAARSTRCSGSALVITLRAMARRWRDGGRSRRPTCRTGRARARPPGARGGAEMSTADAVAGVLWIGVTFYAVFGGADFGAGFWALLGRRRRARQAPARADRLGDRPRLGGEPRLADLRPGRALDGLLRRVRRDHLDAVHPAEPRRARDRAARLGLRLPEHRAHGSRAGDSPSVLFGLSSLLTPFFMGTVVGAIASGRVPVGNAEGDAVTSWLNPLSLLVGALFVATCAYLAAVFLVSDARRAGAADLERYFTTRALAAAVVAGALGAAGIIVLHDDARYVYDGLTSDGLPLVILSALCGPAVLVLLRRGVARGPRPLAIGAVVAVIWGWGVAQHPYLLPTTLKISAGAAPSATLTAVLIVFGVAVVLVVPSIGLLFTLQQRSVIEETEAPHPGPAQP